MPRLKFFASLLLSLVVVFGRVGVVYAASHQQDDAFITGTVQGVVVEAGSESGVQTVVVTLLVNGELQTVQVSMETAVSLGLLVLDGDGKPVVNEAIVGTTVKIDPTSIIPDQSITEEKQHPVGAKVAEFFSGLFDVDYEKVMTAHSDGFGFGVISQAAWITHALGGDASLFQSILDAKKSGDYSLVALPDGTIPQNWGQFKKAVLKGEDGNSLGDLMSGGNGKSENSRNDNGQKGNGKPDNTGEHGKPADPGNGNGKPENPGNGNKPENPPGQVKDKTKDDNANKKDK